VSVLMLGVQLHGQEIRATVSVDMQPLSLDQRQT